MAYQENELLAEVMEHLDLGVIALDGALKRVRFANRDGEAALAALGGSARRPPEPLQAAARRCLRDLANGWAHAVEVRARDGRRLRVRARPADEGRDLVVATVAPPPPPGVPLRALVRRRFGLSPREAELVQWVCAGLSNDEIAQRSHLTVGTVKQYLHAVFVSFGVGNRTQLVARVNALAADAELSR